MLLQESVQTLTSARTGSAINASDVIDSGALRAQEPRCTVQFQGRLVTIVLDILAAVKRVRDQFLKHLGGELPIRDAEGKVALDDGSDVHLGRQVVLDDRLS